MLFRILSEGRLRLKRVVPSKPSLIKCFRVNIFVLYQIIYRLYSFISRLYEPSSLVKRTIPFQSLAHRAYFPLTHKHTYAHTHTHTHYTCLKCICLTNIIKDGVTMKMDFSRNSHFMSIDPHTIGNT